MQNTEDKNLTAQGFDESSEYTAPKMSEDVTAEDVAAHTDKDEGTTALDEDDMEKDSDEFVPEEEFDIEEEEDVDLENEDEDEALDPIK